MVYKFSIIHLKKMLVRRSLPSQKAWIGVDGKRLFLLSILCASQLFSMDKAQENACIDMACVAAANGRIDWLKALNNTTAGYCLALRNAQGATPLFIACQKGNYEIVDYLAGRVVKASYDELLLNSSTGEKIPCTCLHMAAASGHEEIVARLLRAGAPAASCHAPKKRIPLHFATANGHVGIIKRLIDNHPKKILELDTDDNTPLSLAIQHPNPAVFAEFQKSLPLILCAQEGHKNGIKALLKMDVDLEVKDPMFEATALMWAANNDHVEVIELLMEAGADFETKNNKGLTALDCAKARKKTQAVELLELLIEKKKTSQQLALNEQKEVEKVATVEQKAEPAEASHLPNELPIKLAHIIEYARNGNISSLVNILKTNAAVVVLEDQDALGNTPLIWAARYGWTEAVKILVEAGANVWARNNAGQTAFDCASWYKIKEFLKSEMVSYRSDRGAVFAE